MSSEKSFDPTPSRLARARREGDLPRSRDLAALAAFGCGALASALALPLLASVARAALLAASERR
ncbi:MAG: EscU/YscU/HrcU family type III secretion system export apparatus switch protein, partial [Vulcanimicrobiaceae bacterium]